MICLAELFIIFQTLVQSQFTVVNYRFRTVNLTLSYVMKADGSMHSGFLNHGCSVFIAPLKTWLWEYRLSCLAQQCRIDLVFKVQANTKRPRGFLLHWNSKSDYFGNQKRMNTSSTFSPDSLGHSPASAWAALHLTLSLEGGWICSHLSTLLNNIALRVFCWSKQMHFHWSEGGF